MCSAILIATLNSHYMYHKFVPKLALHHLRVTYFFLWFLGVACCFLGLRIAFWGFVLLLGVAWSCEKICNTQPKGVWGCAQKLCRMYFVMNLIRCYPDVQPAR